MCVHVIYTYIYIYIYIYSCIDVREGPERCPRGAQEVLETCFSVARPAAAHASKINGQNARGCPTFLIRIVKLPFVFVSFRDQRVFCTGVAF